MSIDNKKPFLRADEVKTIEDLNRFILESPMPDYVPPERSEPYRVDCKVRGTCSAEMIKYALDRSRVKLTKS